MAKFWDKVKSVFFEEVDDEVKSDDFQFTSDTQRQFSHFDITGSPETSDQYPEVPLINELPPQQQPVYNYPQEEIPEKKEVLPSVVISPIYGRMTDPIPATQVNQPQYKQQPNVLAEYSSVVSPFYGYYQPETPPVTSRPIQNTMGFNTNYQTPLPQNNIPNNPTFAQVPPSYSSPLEQKNATNTTQESAPVFNDPQPYYEPKASSAETTPLNQNFIVTETATQPTLFGESVEIPIVAESTKPLKRRKRQANPVPETFDSLFDDFDANFTTQQFDSLVEEQGSEDVDFNKFDLFSGD